jgi:hypothetical protein
VRQLNQVISTSRAGDSPIGSHIRPSGCLSKAYTSIKTLCQVQTDRVLSVFLQNLLKPRQINPNTSDGAISKVHKSANFLSLFCVCLAILFTAPVVCATPEIDLHGNNIPIRDGSLHAQPNNLTYFDGIQVSGGTISRTFTIYNSGTSTLTLDGSPKVTITGTHSTDFSVIAQPTSPVSPGGNATFTIEFDPSDDGYRLATVNIYNNDTDEGLYDFILKGRGIGNTVKTWELGTNLSTADASFWSETGDYASGYSLSSAGDVNGDGFDDLLIGSPRNGDGGSDAGQTYLILGKASGWKMDENLSSADASFWGEDLGDQSGYSVASAGDVNGDGYDDILIGAPENDDGGDGAGQTYLILGKTGGWTMDTDLSAANASFWGENALDHSGTSIATAGDVNGDGYDDLLIGAPENREGGSFSPSDSAGQTYLILGKSSGWSMDTSLADSDASFWGEGLEDSSGHSVSTAGDVNGDGYDDLLIGAHGSHEDGIGGQTYLILGKPDGWAMDTSLSNADASFLGENGADRAGWSVSSAGDLNGDGLDDLLIGSPFNGDGGSFAGQTYLFLGKAAGWAMDTSLSTADASFWGEDSNDYSGYSVSSIGDINGDGYADLLIGSPYAGSNGSVWNGQAHLMMGKESGWEMDTHLSTANFLFWGEVSGAYLGWAVSTAGDVNGDGYDDLLIEGSIGYVSGFGTAYPGQTYLILGGLSQYIISSSATPVTGGTVGCSPDSVFRGEDSSCVAIPYIGYQLSHWSGDCSGTVCQLTEILGPKAVTAHFIENPGVARQCHNAGTVTPPSHTQSEIIQSETTLTTSGNVQVGNGFKVAYLASTSITLTPGFHADRGSTFQARTTPVTCPVGR